MVTFQVADYCRRQEAAMARTYNWGTLIVCLLFAGSSAFGIWQLWPLHGFTWIAAIALAVVGLISCIGGMAAFAPPSKAERDAESPSAAQV